VTAEESPTGSTGTPQAPAGPTENRPTTTGPTGTYPTRPTGRIPATSPIIWTSFPGVAVAAAAAAAVAVAEAQGVTTTNQAGYLPTTL
jgi:hypothetical protein